MLSTLTDDFQSTAKTEHVNACALNQPDLVHQLQRIGGPKQFGTWRACEKPYAMTNCYNLTTTIKAMVDRQESFKQAEDVLNFLHNLSDSNTAQKIQICHRCHDLLVGKSAELRIHRGSGLCAFHSGTLQPTPLSLKINFACASTIRQASGQKPLLSLLKSKHCSPGSPLFPFKAHADRSVVKTLSICGACYSRLRKSQQKIQSSATSSTIFYSDHTTKSRHVPAPVPTNGDALAASITPAKTIPNTPSRVQTLKAHQLSDTMHVVLSPANVHSPQVRNQPRDGGTPSQALSYLPVPYAPRHAQWSLLQIRDELSLLQKAIISMKPYSPETISLICDPLKFQDWCYNDLNIKYLYAYHFREHTNQRRKRLPERHEDTTMRLLDRARETNKNADLLSLCRAMLLHFRGLSHSQVTSVKSTSVQTQSTTSKNKELARIMSLRVSALKKKNDDATRNGHMIAFGIDDYFNYLSKIKPRIDAGAVVAKVANVIIIIIPEPNTAVPLADSNLPPLRGTNLQELLNEFRQQQWMENGIALYFTEDKYMRSFFNCDVYSDVFNDHDAINHRVSSHHYQSYLTEDHNVNRRLLGNVYLLDRLPNNTLHSFEETKK